MNKTQYLLKLFRSQKKYLSFTKFLDSIEKEQNCPFCKVPCKNEHCPYNKKNYKEITEKTCNEKYKTQS